MLHLRVVSPADRTEAVCRALDEYDGVTNVVVLTGAARRPVGDVVLCDVNRETANQVLDVFDSLGVSVRGSVTAERIDLSLSRNTAFSASSDDSEAVVWQEFRQRVVELSRLNWSFLAFLVIAVLIAAIGIMQDSSILIVGAMVLGPEFGPIAALCLAVMRGRIGGAWTALRTLLVGYLTAMLVTLVATWLLSLPGWVDSEWLDVSGRATEFILKPDRWSFTVALLAGVAGVLSLTSDKSSALVGVFISVTTVPAAAYAALAAALSHWDEVGPSMLQLGLNLTGMCVSGLITLFVLRAVWGHAGLGSRIGRAHSRGMGT
ncbi:DUF389 domain-containing protein [Stackebrandtia albiflava]|uniref:DUF389 domain-containing protein n=1 Tax=Stackebrandtia albiflava TaxID=406432 RepID=UPI0011BE661E|nr:DUF389 domain-containing protein [Stackebrandtia albiflava]